MLFRSVLTDTKTYSVRIRCVGSRTDAQGDAHELHEVLAHATAGALVVDDDFTTVSAPNGQAWTFVVSATGLTLRVTATGTAGQNVDFKALFEWTELGGF